MDVYVRMSGGIVGEQFQIGGGYGWEWQLGVLYFLA